MFATFLFVLLSEAISRREHGHRRAQANPPELWDYPESDRTKGGAPKNGD